LCSSGSAVCTPGANTLAFDFDECQLTTGDIPLLLDGDVLAIPGNPLQLQLVNLFINNNDAVSGNASVLLNNCENYTVDVDADGTNVNGTVTICPPNDFPTGQTLVVSVSDFVITITFNGTSIAPATATQSGTLVATCTINLDTDPLSSSCSEP
jgi:hypothetical protein